MTTVVRTVRPSLDHGFARFLRMAISGSLAAAILNLLGWWIAEGVQNIPVMVMPPGGDVMGLSIGILLMAGIIPAIGAALLYWILDRITNSPMLWFVIASIIVLIAMYFRPGTLPASVSVASKNWLQILHLTTAVGIIWAVLYVRGWFPIRDRA